MQLSTVKTLAFVFALLQTNSAIPIPSAVKGLVERQYYGARPGAAAVPAGQNFTLATLSPIEPWSKTKREPEPEAKPVEVPLDTPVLEEEAPSA